MMLTLKFVELISCGLLAIICAYCAHQKYMDSYKWTRGALALLAVTSMIRLGALIAPMLGIATVSANLLQSARSLAPALCASILIAILSRKINKPERNNTRG